MGDLVPLAFDIETSGIEPGATITVAGIASTPLAWLVLNTGGRPADEMQLRTTIESQTQASVKIAVRDDEAELLTALSNFANERIDGDRHYLTAFNGETWNDGFDLPFLRRACIRQNVDWPFPDIAYADMMDIMQRIETEDNDLASVYDELIGNDHCDPFTDSESAVGAYEQGEWVDLLLHNLADIQRTHALARLGGRFVPRSDFRMKNLAPPDV
ncbi:hypothetical protein [Halorussus sp. AFM4]|uniref:hypothetical protein n=1 Tax=Halorussus sp. AFM4 TaxID=3421651 RepID=UPI003EBAC6A9